MELQKISELIFVASERIDKATREIYKLAKDKANAEHAYRKSLSMEIIKLRAEGVQATLIPDISRGNVADLKLQRDLADGMYKSAIESLRALQAELSGLQSILRIQSDI